MSEPPSPNPARVVDYGAEVQAARGLYATGRVLRGLQTTQSNNRELGAAAATRLPVTTARALTTYLEGVAPMTFTSLAEVPNPVKAGLVFLYAAAETEMPPALASWRNTAPQTTPDVRLRTDRVYFVGPTSDSVGKMARFMAKFDEIHGKGKFWEGLCPYYAAARQERAEERGRKAAAPTHEGAARRELFTPRHAAGGASTEPTTEPTEVVDVELAPTVSFDATAFEEDLDKGASMVSKLMDASSFRRQFFEALDVMPEITPAAMAHQLLKQHSFKRRRSDP